MTWNTELVNQAGDTDEQTASLDFTSASALHHETDDEPEEEPHITNVEKPPHPSASWTVTESTGEEYGVFDPFNGNHLCCGGCDGHADPKTPLCRHVAYIRHYCTPVDEREEPPEFDPDDLDTDERAE